MSLKPRLSFILACIFLDALGIALIVPVLPHLIGVLAETRESQTWWYGVIMLSYGVMQFASAPLLGALSDRIGRRPVLLGGIFGLGLMFAVPALSTSLPLILTSRIVGGMLSANMVVAQAYIADITTGFQRAAGFGKIGATLGLALFLVRLSGAYSAKVILHSLMVASIITIGNFMYGLFVLPESLTQRETRPLSLRNNNPLSAIWRLIRNKINRPLVIVLALSVSPTESCSAPGHCTPNSGMALLPFSSACPFLLLVSPSPLSRGGDCNDASFAMSHHVSRLPHWR